VKVAVITGRTDGIGAAPALAARRLRTRTEDLPARPGSAQASSALSWPVPPFLSSSSDDTDPDHAL
jgi:hypothetical protein